MKTIKKYRIIGLLGKGGMGTVYKAVIPHTEKIVALKVCEPRDTLVSILGIGKIRRQFIKEAVTMARLKHPNIAEVWDMDEDNGKPFFVMEYYCNSLGTMIGETYEDRPSRPLSVDAAIHYGGQALAGLARLHYAGIIHMDLKPYNMMITDEDIIKLIDFGVSKIRGEQVGGPASIKMGTPYYMAPEQEDNPDSADERSDLYSIGVMLFRMLTGRLPDGRTDASSINPDLDEAWDRFLKIASHPVSDSRFAEANQMLTALDRLAKAWEEKKAKTCALIEEASLPETLSKVADHSRLRSTPVKVGLKQGKDLFNTDGMWRPKHVVTHVFKDKGDGTVLDETAGLLWEKGGTPYPMTWYEAQEYMNELNKKRFAGYSDWRLPTVNELMSLFIKHTDPYQFCFEPVFDTTQQRIWSADKKSFVAAWYADAKLGFVWWQDFTCFFYARAVRSLQ
ncbi:MAG: DUF1566 domain-containing protein [Desulfobacterales bacterium]|nr:MAG: DUF1566 domain-containing protein [Desulfobacterales bacterium]